MPKSFEDIKKALEASADGAELVEALTAHVDSQRIDASRAANAEAKKLRDAKKGLEARLKTVGEAFETDLMSDDAEEKIAELKNKIKPGSPGGKSGEGLDPETKKTLNDLKASLAEEKRLRLEAQAASEADKKRSMLTDALGKAGVHKEQVADYAELLSARLKIENGKVLGVLNGEDVTFEEVVTDFIKARPSAVANNQQPGAGSSKNGGHGQPETGPLRVTQAQMKDPAWYQANQKTILQRGYEYADAPA